MYEKVNPCHPDKVADRIAGALVDIAYQRQENPRIAVEVLIGHGYCYVIAESSATLTFDDVEAVAARIIGKKMDVRLVCVPQDEHLADNQKNELRCGDNGIFKGVPVSEEEQILTIIAGDLYKEIPYDGKYIIETLTGKGTANRAVTICQSNMSQDFAEVYRKELKNEMGLIVKAINPLGPWTGGTDVDAGATNRKLGSDMGRGVTGGGLHGKDLSKADVSVNIMCHIIAQERQSNVSACCAIGDTSIDFLVEHTLSILSVPYERVVVNARDYIQSLGGFEKFAEWGLIRP